MSEYSINMMLMGIMSDESYNEEIRLLAEQLIKSKCPIEAKIAIIEECIEARKN